jgi:DNA-binding CsgD family transcriptional regulator/uncharacterized protein (DUF486 family)
MMDRLNTPIVKRAATNRQSLPSSMVRCGLALFFIFLGTWLLNQYTFPFYDTISWNLRDACSLLNGIVFVVIAFVAGRSTQLFTSRRFIVISFVCALVPLGFLAPALLFGAPACVIVSALCGAVARGFVYVAVGLACVDVSLSAIGIVLISAMIASYCIQIPCSCISFSAGVTLQSLIVPFTLLVIAKPILNRGVSTREEINVKDAQISQPPSFISLASQVFVCMLVFRFMFGIGLTFGESDRAPVWTWYEAIAFAALGIYVLQTFRLHKKLDTDVLFRIACLCVLAGLLLIPSSSILPSGTANALLLSGSDIFELVSWYILIAIGSRNRLYAVSVFSWGTAMKSFGVVMGAFAGRLFNGNSDSVLIGPSQQLLLACIALGFAAYIMYLSGHHSFNGIIDRIKPVAKVLPAMLDADFDGCCQIIERRFGLTPRECDVFLLLAHGRNGRYIQEHLVISYNTVKTHVSHVYDKLGIHSQQDLINLVEEERSSAQ